MLRKITNNIGLKLLSAFFAVILWLVVVNVDNPKITKTFYNIEVEVTNEDVVEDNNQVYEILDDTNRITVQVTGRRSYINNLKTSDLVAVADMNNINSDQTLVPIEVTSQKYSENLTITRSVYNLLIKVQESDTEQFAINVTTSGDPADGYALGDISCNPSVIKVTGAKSVVSEISKAVVEADVQGLNSTPQDPLTSSITFLDSDGDEVDSTNLEYDSDPVEISVEILKTKEVELNLEVTGTVEDGYIYTDISYQPETITVKGDSAVLDAYDTLAISDPQLSIDGASADIEDIVVDISQYLPEGMELVDEDQANVAVTIEVSKLKTKTFDISKDDITVDGISEGLEWAFADDDDVEIDITGPVAQINELTADDLDPLLDITDKPIGTYNVPIELTLPDDCEADSTVKIMVVITAADE